MTATVWQPACQEGKAMFQAILSIAAGTSWQPTTLAIPGVVVTKDNVDKFLADPSKRQSGSHQPDPVSRHRADGVHVRPTPDRAQIAPRSKLEFICLQGRRPNIFDEGMRRLAAARLNGCPAETTRRQE